MHKNIDFSFSKLNQALQKAKVKSFTFHTAKSYHMSRNTEVSNKLFIHKSLSAHIYLVIAIKLQNSGTIRLPLYPILCINS